MAGLLPPPFDPPSSRGYAVDVPSTSWWALPGFAGLLWRNRWVMLGSIVTVVGLVAVYTWRARPVYEASSMLRFAHEQVNLPQLVQQLATESRISTEIEVLQGPTAAGEVIDSLGLRAEIRAPRRAQITKLFSVLRVDPGADTATLMFRAGPDGYSMSPQGTAAPAVSARWDQPVTVGGVTVALGRAATSSPAIVLHIGTTDDALHRFQKSLRVSRPARDADLIQVRVVADDPEIAARAANLLAGRLIQSREAELRSRAGLAVAFLHAQVDTLRNQLQTAEDSLQRYRERARAVDPAEQARTQVGRLAQVEADRGGLKAERDALAAVMAQISQDTRTTTPNGPSPYRRLIGYPALLRNQAAGELLNSLTLLENERSVLLRRRTWQDDDVKSLTARIGDLDSQLKNIATTYLDGMTSHVAGLDRVAWQFGRSLDSLPKKEVHTARLERDASILSSLYTAMQTRLKDEQVNLARQDPAVRLVDRARPADEPLRPRPATNLALALVIGGLLGFSLSLWREVSDRSIRSRVDVLRASGMPVLAAFPRVPGRFGGVMRRLRGPRLAAFPPMVRGQANPEEPAADGRPMSPAAAELARRLVLPADAPGAYSEAFNQLQTTLGLSYPDRPLNVLVFTSPLPGEGKTLTAINYALTAAARGQNVLLVDADTRCGIINQVFGRPREPGLTDMLADRASLDDAIHSISVSPTTSIALLPTGALITGPSRDFTLERLTQTIGMLRTRFDLVVIDSPPLNMLADAALLGAAADGVIVVARAGKTQREAFAFAMAQLSAVRAPVIGTLLNDIDLTQAQYGDATYRYLSGVEKYHAVNG